MSRSTTTASHNDPERFRYAYLRRWHLHPHWCCTPEDLDSLASFAVEFHEDAEYRQRQQEMTNRYRRRWVSRLPIHMVWEAIWFTEFFDAVDSLEL